MKSRAVVLVAGCCTVAVCVAVTNAVIIETVTVGNAGNAADTRYDSTGYGAVDYAYSIGKYEVTAGQYCEFLNAVAAEDTYELYNTRMDTTLNSYGCNIKRTGTSGSYTYTVASDWADRPVNYVSWGDAARFANWLHNGQTAGAQDFSTTEDGAYYLNGATSDAALGAVSREADGKWAIPTEDEWYKAAYYNPGTTSYYDYPTGSNSVPSNDLINPDPGNNATFYDNGYTVGSPYRRSEAGAHENSDSPYGTFDQGGNVWEWNEAILYGGCRGVRGGSFHFFNDVLRASYRPSDNCYPSEEKSDRGFRVALVPEPASAMLLAVGFAVAFCRRRSR